MMKSVAPCSELQFGQGYSRLRDFRAVFLKTLKVVMTQDPRAKVHADEKGLVLHLSPPPIAQLSFDVLSTKRL